MSMLTLGTGFSRALLNLEKAIQIWETGGISNLRVSMKTIGVLVKGQAKRRVPVASNRLKQGIISVTFDEGVSGVSLGGSFQYIQGCLLKK